MAMSFSLVALGGVPVRIKDPRLRGEDLPGLLPGIWKHYFMNRRNRTDHVFRVGSRAAENVVCP